MIDARNVTLDDAQIIFKHFSGDKFSNNLPTFCVRLDDDTAAEFREAGWPVKTWVSDKSGNSDQQFDPTQFMKLKVSFRESRDGITPKIVAKDTGTGKKTRYDANNIHRLDELSIKRAVVDMFRAWSDQYQCWYIGLNRLYLEIESDELDRLMDMDDDDWTAEDVDSL